MTSPESPAEGAPTARWAWIWLATVPVFIVIGLLAGYFVQGILDDDATKASLVTDIVVAAVMLPLWLTPCLFALDAGRSGGPNRSPSNRVAAVVASALAVLACVLIMGQILYNLVTGLYG
ncbi:MAG: hypothetical protein WBG57_09580 [Ornithinimicrobium sp.]